MERPATDWSEERSLRIASGYKFDGYAPFGDAPNEYLTGEALAKRGISDALVSLVTACPDKEGRGLLARLIAERVVVEALKSDGRDLVAFLKLLLDYTDGTPTHKLPEADGGELRERIITIVQRADGYESGRG